MSDESVSTLQLLLRYIYKKGDSFYKAYKAYKAYEDPRSTKSKIDILDLRDMLASQYTPIANGEWETKLTRLKSGCDLDGRFLFLKPIEAESVIPVMTFEFNRNAPSLKIRFALFTESGGNLSGVAYRLESPSNEAHPFYHAQPIKKLSLSSSEEIEGWIPERDLTFPLDAKDPVTLLLCFLIALYRTEIFREMENNVRKKLVRLSADMHLHPHVRESSK